MGQRLSRRKIAAHFAGQLLDGKKTAVKELAAFLLDSGRERELDLIVRDIEAALAERGVLLADVASSRGLSANVKKDVEAYLKSTTGAKEIHLRETVDPELLGGLRVTTPDSELDATLKHRLNQLKASKI